MTNPFPCVDPMHFQVDSDGSIAPQPWMQYRQVATNSAPGRSGSYAPTITTQANKNDLLQDVTTAWTNDSPLPQWVYGMITTGGSRVTLQARSRGALTMVSGYQEGTPTPGANGVPGVVSPMVACAVHGCGADMSLGGVLASGVAYGVMEVRLNAASFALAPERAGWHKLAPGATFTGQVQRYFTSDYWETTSVEGGSLDLESDYLAGPLRLDLFAIPVL